VLPPNVSFPFISLEPLFSVREIFSELTVDMCVETRIDPHKVLL
jgi:hypothetical protein